MPIITGEIIESGKSSNNGWSVRQIQIFGEDRRRKGWLRRLVGKSASQEQIDEFLSLKDAHFKNGVTLRLEKKPLGLKFVGVAPGSIKWIDQYKHPNWQRYRTFIFNRDGFRCINCRSKHDTLHAHHLKYSKNPNDFIWSVPHWYIVTLCEKCHSDEHSGKVFT